MIVTQKLTCRKQLGSNFLYEKLLNEISLAVIVLKQYNRRFNITVTMLSYLLKSEFSILMTIQSILFFIFNKNK